MRNSIYIVAFCAAFLVPVMFAKDIHESPPLRYSHHHNQHASGRRTRHSTMLTPNANEEREKMRQTRAHPLQIAGSRLPDCSHACGSCSPCRLSSVCASPSQAETCPISYRCMCKNKSYPIP